MPKQEEAPSAAGRAEAPLPNMRLVLIAIVLYAAARNLVQATIKPLWFDELLTELLSREPSVSALWRALKTAVDGQPPLFYLIERVASWFPANEHIAYRLPSIFAFSATLICLYLFVSRRSGPLVGTICASVIFLTPLYTTYADEARPYSMFVACVAFALVCYQRAPRLLWTIGLWLSLSLATCLHYYGVLALSPFIAAEIFFTLRMRRFRALIWAALLLPVVPLAFFRPLLAAMKLAYAHFWAQPHLLDALKSYGELFGVDTPWGFAFAGITAIAVLLALAQTEFGSIESSQPSPGNELVLVLCLLAYPLIVFVATKFAHGGYTPRYVFCAILGVAIALQYVLAWFPPRGAWLAAAFLTLAFGAQEFSFWRTLPSNIGEPTRAAEGLLALVDSVHQDGLPVVISDPGEYFEISHYAPPELKKRIVAVVDPPSAYLYLGTDTVDNIMLALRQLAPVDVYRFSEFTAAHGSFLVYSNGSSYDWLPRRLAKDGVGTRALAIDKGGTVFFVDLHAKGN